MIRIEFCAVCSGYRHEADKLAKYLRDKGQEVELIEAGKGRFHVYVDGDLIFSVKKCKKYPNADEIIEMINL